MQANIHIDGDKLTSVLRIGDILADEHARREVLSQVGAATEVTLSMSARQGLILVARDESTGQVLLRLPVRQLLENSLAAGLFDENASPTRTAGEGASALEAELMEYIALARCHAARNDASLEPESAFALEPELVRPLAVEQAILAEQGA